MEIRHTCYIKILAGHREKDTLISTIFGGRDGIHIHTHVFFYLWCTSGQFHSKVYLATPQRFTNITSAFAKITISPEKF